MNQITVSFMLPFLKALLIVAIFAAFGAVIYRIILQLSKKWQPESRYLAILLTKIVYIILLIFGVITALENIGAHVSGLIAGLGLSSFAIGFALKDILTNIFGGIYIVIYRPFNVGHTIKIGDHTGVVEAVDLRYITLATDHNKTLIPNATIFTTAITLLKDKA